MNPAILDIEFAEVIKTSKGAAYLRGLSDIKYAAEISQLIGAERIHNEIMAENAKSMEKYTPFIEARYKAINKLLVEYNSKTIFELASGFSPRSLELSIDPVIKYIDTDLNELIVEKEKVFRGVLEMHNESRDNLYFESLNVLDFKKLNQIIKDIGENNITFVSEGLLAYLDRRQQRILAENIYFILRDYGGIWITSDLPVKKRVNIEKERDNEVKTNLAKVSDKSGKNIENNMFEDSDEMEEFFKSIGFNISFKSQSETISESDLSSITRLSLSKDEISSQLSLRKIMVLSV